MFGFLTGLFKSLPQTIDQVMAGGYLKRVRSRRSADAIEKDLAALSLATDSADNHLSTEIGRLLPVEKDLRKTLEERKTKLLAQATERRRKLEIERLNALYDVLSPGFLAAKQLSNDELRQLPSFALFPVDSAKLTVGCSTGAYDYNAQSYRHTVTGIPQSLVGYFNLKDVKTLANKHSSYRHQICLGASFTGIIPSQARARIEAVRKDFDQLYLVVRAPRWDAYPGSGPFTPTPPGTVLLVGEKHHRFWVMDNFTPIQASDFLEQALEAALA